jgi:hypothetical protein
MKITVELNHAQASALIAFGERLAATPSATPCNFPQDHPGLGPLQEAVQKIAYLLCAARISGMTDAEDAIREFHDGPPGAEDQPASQS